MSGGGSGGIEKGVASHLLPLARLTRSGRKRARASVGAVTALALVTGVAGCGLRGLAHDQLYGSADAGRLPDGAGPAEEAGGPGDAGGSRDGAIDVTPEVGPEDGGQDGGALLCHVDSCAADQLCDVLSGACLPQTATGMLSGAITDACNHTVVETKIGIAGRRQCSAAQKGAYYFSQLPLGKLTLTAAAPGYDLFVAEVTIVPGGNVLNVALVRTSPVGCADPQPTAVMCTCTESGCP